MTDQQIEVLKAAVKTSRVMWNPDIETARVVVLVDEPPKLEPGEEPEPSQCAYLAGGGYVALYNCQLSDFCSATILTSHPYLRRADELSNLEAFLDELDGVE